MPAVQLQERGTGKDPETLNVSQMRLLWHSLFTGGALPEAATFWQRLWFRCSTASHVRSCLAVDNTGTWTATPLYQGLESSEKGFASYRIGTTCAGVFADLKLGIWVLQHRQALIGSSSGDRGDLLGRAQASGLWHGVEAKGHGPNPHTGLASTVSPLDYAKAKSQALSLGIDILNEGLPLGPGHWAVTTLAGVGQPLTLVVEDPPAEAAGGGGNAGGVGPDFHDEDPEERVLQAYYQILRDIEDEGFTRRGFRRVPESLEGRELLGIKLPNADLWIGAEHELFEARRESRLAPELNSRRDRAPVETDDSLLSPNGLAVARIPQAP